VPTVGHGVQTKPETANVWYQTIRGEKYKRGAKRGKRKKSKKHQKLFQTELLGKNPPGGGHEGAYEELCGVVAQNKKKERKGVAQ